MRHLLPILPLISGLSSVLGCAGTVSGTGDGVDAESASSTSAFVAIERTTDTAEGSRAEASARFIRVTAPSSAADALRAIGASIELPSRGSCSTIASLGDENVAQVPLVELLNVGEVTLQANGVETRLAARQLPDVTDLVNGVVYARATDPATLPAEAPYVLHIAGAQGLDAIDVAATAPADPSDVRIDGEDTPGRLVAAGSTVDMAWSSQEPDDLVYVDVRPNGVRCVLAGVNRGSVSTLYLSDAGTLVIHRLRRESLVAHGIDTGEVRFDFARTLTYVRR